ncbi:MAG: hypothetical protein MUC81_06105 [Bacteroidia bacterium]|jgi:hypothetical protein|nr:hypothetical protein [Bacteroidia bacterium]
MIRALSNNKPLSLLCAAFLIELLLLFYLRNVPGFFVSPVLIAFTGLFIAYYPIYSSTKKTSVTLYDKPGIIKNKTVTKTVFFTTLISCVLIYWGWSFILFQRHPLDINQSDILPFIKVVYLDRLSNGEAVYSSFTGFNYGTFTPSYLPAHWMPFIIPYWLNIDLRWAVVAVFSLAALIYTFYIVKIDNKQSGLFKLILPWILVFSIYIKQPVDGVHTIEIMVIGYYLMLGVLLFSSHSLLQAFGIVLPLMSRYSFLFWLPIYGFILWLNQRVQLLKIIAGSLFFLSIIFLPFIIQSPEMFKDFNGNYLRGVIYEWQGQPWQKSGDRPFQLFQGMGVASWFYLWFNGSLEDKIIMIKNVLLAVSVIFMLWQLFLVWKVKNKINPDLLALLTLKAALTLFYLFIMVPYVYLNWVPLIVSIVIISRFQLPSTSHETINS